MTAKSSQRRSRSATSPATPGSVRVPATVWTLGAEPLDPGERWPARLIARTVREFSDVGARVLVLDGPARSARGGLRVIEADTAAALAQIRDLNRRGIEASDPEPGPVDLVIASLLGEHHDLISAAERVSALATEVMAMGALLVVLARCRHSETGVLLDPAGPVVSAAQAADLLYLQHIIAAPVTGRTVTAPADPAEPGLPRPTLAHVVAHTDVLVFLQPAHA